jgi:hypothetical protein
LSGNCLKTSEIAIKGDLDKNLSKKCTLVLTQAREMSIAFAKFVFTDHYAFLNC